MVMIMGVVIAMKEKCMSALTLPSGISIRQAKRDAKTLSKTNGIQLSKAQNLIAFKHGRSSWATLINQLATQNALELSFNNHEQKLSFPEGKTLSIIEGRVNSGKTALLMDIASQLVKAGYPITYLCTGLSKTESLRLKELSSKTKINCPIIIHDLKDPNLDFTSIALDGSILLIDEFETMLRVVPIALIHDILKTSLHTIITVQAYADVEQQLGNSGFPIHNLQMFVLGVKASRFGIVLLHESNKFIEFLYVSKSKTQIHTIKLVK